MDRAGGGTRAAAFSYGVMQELAATRIAVGGKEQRLLDEVDVVSGVSGGSFPAAYYALYGDRIFTEFEPLFLRKDVEGALLEDGERLPRAERPEVDGGADAREARPDDDEIVTLPGQNACPLVRFRAAGATGPRCAPSRARGR